MTDFTFTYKYTPGTCPTQPQLSTSDRWAVSQEQLEVMTKPAAILSIISTPHGVALIQESQGVVLCRVDMDFYFHFFK